MHVELQKVIESLLNLADESIAELSKTTADDCLLKHSALKQAAALTWSLFLNSSDNKNETYMNQLINNYANGTISKKLMQFYAAVNLVNSFTFFAEPQESQDSLKDEEPTLNPEQQQMLDNLQDSARFYLNYMQHKDALTHKEELLRAHVHSLDRTSISL